MRSRREHNRFPSSGFAGNRPPQLNGSSFHGEDNLSHWARNCVFLLKRLIVKATNNLKRCQRPPPPSLIRVFDAVVGMGGVQHRASSERNTNWILMRSTFLIFFLSVSEELFFYILMPELLSRLAQQIHHAEDELCEFSITWD